MGACITRSIQVLRICGQGGVTGLSGATIPASGTRQKATIPARRRAGRNRGRQHCAGRRDCPKQRGEAPFQDLQDAAQGPHGEILGTVGLGHDLSHKTCSNLDVGIEFLCGFNALSWPFAAEDGTIRKGEQCFSGFFLARKRDNIVGQSFAGWCDNTFQGEISPVNGKRVFAFR